MFTKIIKKYHATVVDHRSIVVVIVYNNPNKRVFIVEFAITNVIAALIFKEDAGSFFQSFHHTMRWSHCIR